MTTRRRPSPIRRAKLRRDVIIVGFALSVAAIDILFLGARPSTLTFCTGLLLSPLVIRYDEARRDEDVAR